jgi:hypothetical protein
VDANCTDINEDILTASLGAYSTNKATVTVTNSGAIYYLNYITKPNSCGTDTVPIQISDGTNVITINYSIQITNLPPTGVSKTFNFNRLPNPQILNTLDVLTGSSDPDGDVTSIYTGSGSIVDYNNCFNSAGKATLTATSTGISFTPYW